jgi:presequence protease
MNNSDTSAVPQSFEIVDGIFRGPSDINDTGSRNIFHLPTLPLSRPRRRWLNFTGYFQPDESEYDNSFRMYRYRSQFCLFFWTTFAVVGVLVTILYQGGQQLASTISHIVPHHAYVLGQQASIKEIQGHMVLYRHKKTQAEVLTIIPDDLEQDAVFGLSITTPADNNRGAAHVLMHSIWDGSENYPLKNPIRRYQEGSLATIIDATCLEDRTMYTVASRNPKDFHNLMRLLLDGIFQPLMLKDRYKNEIFREEAWRIDPEDGSTYNSDNENLQLHGHVFNLQRLVYDNVDEIMNRYARRALFADTRFQFDAQGIPMDILDLTAMEVQNIFNSHYVATNVRVFLYGSVESIQDGLQAFDDYAQYQTARLDMTEKALPQWQPFNLEEAAEAIHAYPIEVGDNLESHTVVSWLLNDYHMTQMTKLAWIVLEYLLIGAPNAALRQQLEDFVDIDSKNATLTPEVFGGLDRQYQQWRFSIGIKGISKDQVKSVQNRIDFALGNIKQFDSDAIAAAMNVVEMKRLDLSSGVLPRGALLFRETMSQWSYNGDIRTILAWSPSFQELQHEIKKNGDKILIELLQSKLVRNSHMARIQLDPSVKEFSKRRENIAQKIIRMRESLTEKEFQNILDESKALHIRRISPDAPSIYRMLPKLSPTDVPQENEKTQSHFSINHRVLTIETPVKSSFGMIYVDFGIDLREIMYEDLALLPLVCRLMLQSGTSAFSADRFANQIEKFSTGIKAEAMIVDVRQKDNRGPLQYHVHDGIHLATKVFFRGNCMAGNFMLYLELLSEILFHGLEFQKDHVLDTLDAMIVEMETKSNKYGDQLARLRLASRYSYKGLLDEQLSGIYQLQFLYNSLKTALSDWEIFQARLSRLKLALSKAHRNGMILSLTGENDLLVQTRPKVQQFLTSGIPRIESNFRFSAPGEEPHMWIPRLNMTQNEEFPFTNEALILATSVNSIAQAGFLYKRGEPINGGTAVAAKYLERAFLYNEIHKESGDAEITVELNFRHGTLTMLSSKDSRFAGTIDIFQNAAKKMQIYFPSSDLPMDAISSIISTIADLDGPAKQPNEIAWEAIIQYLQDDNMDFAKLWRAQILATSRQDFLNFFQSLQEWKSPSLVIVSDNDDLSRLSNSTIRLKIVKVCKHWHCSNSTSTR